MTKNEKNNVQYNLRCLYSVISNIMVAIIKISAIDIDFKTRSSTCTSTIKQVCSKLLDANVEAGCLY
jgi:hypothetical protein